MEEIFEKIPFIGKVVISFLLSVAIPGAVSFTILKDELASVSAQGVENKLAVKDAMDKNELFKQDLSNKLDNIQRSLGRLEGKIENVRR